MRTNYNRGLRILSTAALLIVALALDAQPTVKWRYRAVYGPDDQSCSDVATDGAGNVYMAGFFKNTAFCNTYILSNSDGASGNTDGYLVKYARENTMTATGAVQWAVKFGQTAGVVGANERVTAIATYPNGLGGFDTYVVGYYSNTLLLVSYPTGGPTISLPTAAGSQSGFLAKYDNLGNVVWAQEIDGPGLDALNDVCVSPDGSGGATVYVVGSCGATLTCQSETVPTLPGSGGADAFIMRFDGAGTAQWARRMASATDDAYYSVASATGGDVVITGQITGNGVISYNGVSQSPIACLGTSDIVAVRYDIGGTLTYALNGGGNTNTDAGLATAIDMHGNSYVAGYYSGACTFNTTSTGYLLPNPGVDWEFFILKLDAAGNGVWMRSGGTPADGDAIRSIVVNNLATRIYVAGHFKGALSYNGSLTSLSSFSATNLDGFMLAADANTGLLLSQGELQYGGSSHDDTGRAIAINAAEDVYIGSSISSATNDMDWPSSVSGFSFFANSGTSGSYETGLIRWDHSNWPALADNNTCIHKGMGEWFDLTAWQWKISMGGSFNDTVSFPTAPVSTTLTSTPSSLGPPSQDAYVTTSNTFGDYLSFVSVMDGTGEEMVYDHLTDGVGNNYFTGYGTVVVGENFNFAGGGPSYSMSIGLSAGFLGKRSKTGGNLWGVYFEPFHNSAVEAEGIAIDNSGNIYVTGGFTGLISFGTTAGVPTVLSSTGGYNIFVAKYDNSGVLQWIVNFGSGGSGSEKGYSISVDNNGSYYVTGKFNTTGTLTFGPNNIGPTLNADIFVMKGDASSGAALKGIRYTNATADIGRDVISPSATECYITGAINNNTQCFTARVDFAPANPVWNWTATNTPVTGTAIVIGTDLIMGNNGYLYTSGHVTNPGTLTFGTLTEPVTYHGFLVSYSGWLGTATCLEVYNLVNTVLGPPQGPPLPRITRTYAIALESGANSPDHGDNVLVGGSKGHSTTVNIAYAHKITTEGCVISERRPDPVVPYTVSESALYGSLVYPNPLNGNATLEIRTDVDLSSTPFTVVITDMTGREVSRMNGLTTKLVNINAENFSDGLYYYQVMQEDKMISNGKMVVNH
jgi:hypothetical protein